MADQKQRLFSNNPLNKYAGNAIRTEFVKYCRQVVLSILSCVTEVRHSRSREFGKLIDFLARNYVNEQSTN